MYLLQRSGQHIPYAEQKGAGHLRRASNFETCGQSNVVHHLAILTPDANFTASLRTSMRAFVWALVVRAPCHRLTQLTSGISAVLHTAAYRSTFLSLDLVSPELLEKHRTSLKASACYAKPSCITTVEVATAGLQTPHLAASTICPELSGTNGCRPPSSGLELSDLRAMERRTSPCKSKAWHRLSSCTRTVFQAPLDCVICAK